MRGVTKTVQIGVKTKGEVLDRLIGLRLKKAKLELEKALDCVNLLLEEQEIIKINEITDTVRKALTELNHITVYAMEDHHRLKETTSK